MAGWKLLDVLQKYIKSSKIVALLKTNLQDLYRSDWGFQGGKLKSWYLLRAAVFII